MTEQGGGPVNPGQAIYDALSDEAKAAVDALPNTVFTDPEGVDRSEWFLESLRLAHAGSPECWALMGGPGENGGHGSVILTIGTKNVISMRDKMRFVVFRNLVLQDKLEGGFQHYISYDAYKFRDDIVQVEVDLETPAEALLELKRAHQQTIIRLATGRIGSQGRNHKDDVRVKLALVTDEFVPAPAYVPESTFGLPNGLRIMARESDIEQRERANDAQPVSSSQAIYDALSDQAKTAVDALPSSVFSDLEGVDHSRWLLKSIQLAHTASDSCWGMVGLGANIDNFLALLVGVRNVVSLSDKLRFVVSRDVVREEFVEGGLASYVSYDRYKSRDGFLQVQIDSATDLGTREELERAHRETIALIAKGRIGSQGRNHRDDVRVRLALVTGEYVPAPAYVPESTYGLPNGLRLVSRAEEDAAAHEQRSPVTEENSIPIDVPTLLPEAFSVAGLTYTEARIASFYTALQTKGFVILSGISGTGKSKIAQRFADMLPEIQEPPEQVLAADWVRIDAKPYMRKYKRIRLWNEVSATLPVPAPGTSITVPFSIDSLDGECRVWTRPEANAGTYLFPQGNAGEEFRHKIGDAFALRFKLDGDGSGIESIDMRTELPVEAVHSNQGVMIRNHLFLPVRPDWRDGKALTGYHNPLTGEYVRTEFLEFVIAAGDDYRAGNRNAFFVILDEMNLAHVEYYFADVLSVIESGRDDGGWTVEGIPLAVGEEDTDLPERLHLPPNLYIVGTVNLDETTHPFSPKVLDRAFTIELTDVDFREYPPEPVEGEADLGDAERQALLQAFTRGGRYPRIDKDDIRATVERHGQFRADLEKLNTSLKRYRMHFGYRVFDEIMQFVHNAEENGLFTPAEAFDHAVLMKVLPKFNGSRAKLERALLELIVWSQTAIDATSEDTRAVADKFAGFIDKGTSFDSLVLDAEDWRYPATGKRAALMMQDLYTDGFAAFG